jgi:hypothetical protein
MQEYPIGDGLALIIRKDQYIDMKSVIRFVARNFVEHVFEVLPLFLKCIVGPWAR